MIMAERSDVYCDIGDALSVTIFVNDGTRKIAIYLSSSSIYPRVGYDERRNDLNRFADRIVEAINKGGAK